MLEEWLQGNGGGLNATFISFIIGTLYVALPLVFLTLMSWAGLKVSSAIMGALSGVDKVASSAGQEAGGLAKRAISTGTSAFSKKD